MTRPASWDVVDRRAPEVGWTSTTAPHVYVQCDVPPGQTLAAWRSDHRGSLPPRLRVLCFVLLFGRLLLHPRNRHDRQESM